MWQKVRPWYYVPGRVPARAAAEGAALTYEDEANEQMEDDLTPFRGIGYTSVYTRP